MDTKYILLTIGFLFSFAINAQKEEKISPIKPVSIYTFSKIKTDENGFAAINKKLQLSNFRFGFVEVIDEDLERFSLDAKDSDKKPSTFVYDDLKRTLDRSLVKEFLFKNDPTRWNLQNQLQNLQL